MKSSRERAENYLTVDRISKYKYKDIKSLVRILDQHAADQREIDIKALRNVCQHFMGHSFNTGSLALLEDAILNTVEKSDDKNT